MGMRGRRVDRESKVLGQGLVQIVIVGLNDGDRPYRRGRER